MGAKRTKSADLSALQIDRRGEHEESKSAGSRTIYVGLAVVLAVVLLWFFMGESESSSVIQTTSVMMVSPASGNAILTATGYVVAQRQAAIASKGTGTLVYLGVEEGDEVKTDQIIAQLENEDVQASLNQAKANLAVGKATVEQRAADLREAQLNFERQKELFGRGLISKSDFDIAEARFRIAEAALAASKAQVDLLAAAVVSAEVEFENTRIRAPFDGTVLTKNADVGEMVAPFAASANSRGAVVTVADMNSLEVEADVSESNIQRVSVGQKCEIILDAFPDIRYPSYVHKIVPTADRAKATVMTKIRFTERDGRVLPEMSAKVNFLSATESDVSESVEPFKGVAKSAVAERDGAKVLLVVRDDVVAVTPVETGKVLGEKIEILAGASVGDRVVLNPTSDLESGSKVRTAN
jgi:RND family efflux transporter MFP subunit